MFRIYDGVKFVPETPYAIDPGQSSTVLSSSSSTSTGGTVLLSAFIDNWTAGDVEFRKSDGTLISTITPVMGTASLDVSPQVTTGYYAVYLGGGGLVGSTSNTVTISVTLPTTTVLTSNTLSPVIGTGATITVTVSAGTGTPTGTIYLDSDVGGPAIQTKTLSGGVATFSVNPDVVTTYTARYAGTTGFEASADSVGKTLTPILEIATYTFFSTSATVINAGQTVTLTANVTDGTNPVTTGQIAFEWTRGSGWNLQATVSVNGSGVAQLTPGAPGSSITWRARYVANGAYLGSTSSSVAVTVRSLQTFVTTFNSSWSMSYSGSGGQRTATDCYQGYVSSTWGNQKSLVGFGDMTTTLAAAVSITKVEFYLYADHWYNNSGGTCYLGVHNKMSAPSSWTESGVTTGIIGSAWSSKTGGKWTDITSVGNKDNWKTGGYRGMSIGPGPSTSNAYYSYFRGYSYSSGKPLLRFTYTKWV